MLECYSNHKLRFYTALRRDMGMQFKFSTKFVLSALAAIAWGIVIFSFSGQNGEESSGLSSLIVTALCDLFNYSPSDETMELLTLLIRKAAHITEFGILGLLVLNTLYQGFGSFRRIYAVSFAIASAYAAVDELHQLFIPERSGKITDWMIDSAGIILFLMAAWAIIRTIRVKETLRKYKLIEK